MTSPGAKANYNGQHLEAAVACMLEITGHTFRTQEKLPIPGLFGEGITCDFVVNDSLIIECKWQQKTGTTQQKLPYLVENIKNSYPLPTIIIIDGPGFTLGAIKWLQAAVDNDRLLAVYSLNEAMAWLNNGGPV